MFVVLTKPNEKLGSRVDWHSDEILLWNKHLGKFESHQF